MAIPAIAPAADLDDGLGNFGSAPVAARSRIAARVPIVTAMGGVYRRPHALNAALQVIDDRGRQYPTADERAGLQPLEVPQSVDIVP